MAQEIGGLDQSLAGRGVTRHGRQWLAGIRGVVMRVAASRSWAVTLVLVTLAVAAAMQLFLEETLIELAWRKLLARDLVEEPGGSVGLALLFGTLAARRLARPLRRRPADDAENDLARAVELLAGQPSACAGLVRLGDKKVVFSDCGRAFLMYARRGRSFVALFDPVGERKAWAPLVLKFIDEARASGCRPVFYQVSAEFLPFAVDAGLKPLKLGEQAVIDLDGFSLQGGDWVKLRRSINRAERDGLSFELLAPEAVPAVLDELAAVSDAWLAAHNAAEKGFSLGTFNRDYLSAEPVAVIRIDGKIVAFASILTAAAGGDAFIDLMRNLPGVHRGAMDLLFVRIIERLKADGYRTLNLGMAPLAGISAHRRAPIWNHVARHVFENGERFYNFRGVHAFKSKFDPEWQPRYLAASGAGLPLAALLDVTLLIGGGLKGVLRR